jgi:hypothetical protein
MASDYEGVLARVAAIGYKEIEPAGGYNNMPPAQEDLEVLTVDDRRVAILTNVRRANLDRPDDAAPV